MTQITETVEQYEYRRRQEVQDAAVAKAESNKILNKARQNARFGRFGINQALPRNHEQLAVVAAAEKLVLGISVEPARNIIIETPKNDAVASLPEELNKSINAEKHPQNTLNDVVTDQKLPISEKVDSRHFCDLGKPFVADGGVSLEIGGVSLKGNSTIEELMRDHFNLGGVFLNEGAFLSATEISIMTEGGVSVNKASSFLKELGYVPLKVKGKRGFRVTVRL